MKQNSALDPIQSELSQMDKGVASAASLSVIQTKRGCTKRCRGCGIIKPLSEFYKQKHGRLGHTARCKTCMRLARLLPRNCQDCGKPIGSRATRCRSCASKMKWARGDNDGLAEIMRKYWKAGRYNGNSNSNGFYRDAAWLREQYVDNGLALQMVANRAGCAVSTISIWLRKFKIPCRSRSEAMSMAWERGDFDNIIAYRRTPEYRQKMSRIKKAAWAQGDYDNRKPRGSSQKGKSDENSNEL